MQMMSQGRGWIPGIDDAIAEGENDTCGHVSGSGNIYHFLTH